MVFYKRPQSESGGRTPCTATFSWQEGPRFGSGHGFGAGHFAEHGANVTFVDISHQASNRQRSAELRSSGMYHTAIYKICTHWHTPNNFDFIYAAGSLIMSRLRCSENRCGS